MPTASVADGPFIFRLNDNGSGALLLTQVCYYFQCISTRKIHKSNFMKIILYMYDVYYKDSQQV